MARRHTDSHLSTDAIIHKVEERLRLDFGYVVDITGFSDLKMELQQVPDYDVEALKQCNNSVLMWIPYVQDLCSLIYLSLDRYKNVLDIYEYLESISVKDSEQFYRLAPKYKIERGLIEDMLSVLEAKKNQYVELTQHLKILYSRLDAYRKFLDENYHRTLRLIYSAEQRSFNVAF